MQATNATKKSSNHIWQSQQQQNMLNANSFSQNQQQIKQPIQPPHYQSAARVATTATATAQSLQWSQQCNNNNIQQQHQIAATNNVYNNVNTEAANAYFHQSAVTTNPTISGDFFDNVNVNNNNNNNNNENIQSQATSFGNEWDWDWNWNDNPVEQQYNHNSQQQQQQQQQQEFNINEQQYQKPQQPSVTESFNIHNFNNNWSSIPEVSTTNSVSDNNNSSTTVIATVVPSTKTINVESKCDNWNWNEAAAVKEPNQQQYAAVKVNDKMTLQQQKLIEETPMNKSTEGGRIIASPSLPPPPNEFSTENHNYNIQNVHSSVNNLGQQQLQQSQHITNSVFMSQAKPVTLPTRQYAAPPTSTTQQTVIQSQVQMQPMPPPPPQAFQNPMAAVETLSIPLPPPQQVAVSSALPAKENPFKRSGSLKHHNAGNFMSTPIAMNNVFNVTPSPPADFANPPENSVTTTTTTITTDASTTLLEPENNEQPSQENQEVIMTSSTALRNSNHSISVPVSTYSAAPYLLQQTTPPNDERNQYLQTSHLSEIATVRSQGDDDEQQADIDGLLPPPGLSRLVLGEPEIDISSTSTRLVTGTETPHNNLASNASVMHLEERHADGEDTTDDDTGLVNRCVSGTNNVSNTNMEGAVMTTNTSQQQRVVTGVELAEQREIELDGENLEDQQLRQQSNDQNNLIVVTRNELQVESVANSSVQPLLNKNKNKNNYNNNNNNNNNNSNSNKNINTNNVDITKNKNNNNSNNKNLNMDDSTTNLMHHSTKHNVLHHNQQLGIVSSNEDGNNNDMDDDSDDRVLQDRPISRSNTINRSRTKYEMERSKGGSYGSTGRRSGMKKFSTQHYNSDDEELYSDNEEYSSERERKRGYERQREYRHNYRESSIRSDRSNCDEEDIKHKRHPRNHRSEHQSMEKRDKHNYEEERRLRRERGREREREHEWERSEKKFYNYQHDQQQQRTDKPHRTSGGRSGVDHNHMDNERTRRSDRSDPGNEFDNYHYHHTRERPYRNVKTNSSHSRTYDDDDYDRERRDRPRHRNGANSGGHSANEDYNNTLERRRRGDKHIRDERYRNNNNESRYDPQEYEEYRKNSSRNARDSDLEKESAPPSNRSGRLPITHNSRSNLYGYHVGGAGYYDPYAAYYYSQMARTNPQAYAEWYKKYYSHAMAAAAAAAGGLPNVTPSSVGEQQSTPVVPITSTDDRESVHSGRSSAHNEHKDLIGGGTSSLRDSELMPEHSSIMSTTTEPQRLTPCKFMNEHSIANFSSGILITVQPKYNHQGRYNNNLVKLLNIEITDETGELFRIYPGPLMSGLSHKKTIIEFCENQIRLGPQNDTTIFTKQQSHLQQQCHADKYRYSYTLMWNLLILLLKQNGRVVGTDIAELLLQNQQDFPYAQLVEITHEKSIESNSPEETYLPIDDNNEKEQQQKQYSESDISDKQMSDQKKQEEEEVAIGITQSSSTLLTPILNENDVTDKFRQYLLYGNISEALDWATDHNLWGHALFLASKLERRIHANVMMKFANKLPLNDPLQTLYQLMSGRTPSSVASILDEKWGDWRPHLSMIISNTTVKPELSRKAITVMGDSLFMRGDLYAAHFCYLMAQVGFGRYEETAVLETTLQQHLPKLVLLGSSHYKPFTEFAISKAIIMTEIYEYACSLNDENFSLIDLQPYKYLLAIRLLDCGQHLKSLMYLEQIAHHIAAQPTKYDNSFINKIYVLADRIKYYDPALDKSLGDDDIESTTMPTIMPSMEQISIDEQKWLQTLRQLMAQQENDDANNQQQQYNGTTPYVDIDKQFTDINKQFEELNLQYNTQLQPQQQQVVQNDMNSVYFESSQYPQHSQQQEPQSQTYQMNQENNYTQNINVYGQVEPTTTTGVPLSNTDYGIDQTNNQQYWGSWSMQYQNSEQSTLQPIEEDTMRSPPPPSITLPKTKSYNTEDEDIGSNSITNKANSNSNVVSQGQKDRKSDKETSKKSQTSQSQNSGWFGGIWNKFSLKPKNQMILPDDKNPSIVWDADKKRWVNTDGDDNAENEFKPPPKINDMMLQQHQQQQQQQQIHYHNITEDPQQHQQQRSYLEGQIVSQYDQQQSYVPMMSRVAATNPSTTIAATGNVSTTPSIEAMASIDNTATGMAKIAETTTNVNAIKTPTLQSNMFKMQRNRTLKNSYVDVFNPSGATMNTATDNILAPAVPPAVIPQGSYFIPSPSLGTETTTASSNTNDNNTNNAVDYNQLQQQQTEVPQFYNPNQFANSG